MQRIFIALFVGMASLFLTSAAWADIISISADVPIAFEFDDGGSADSVSGYKIGLALPGIIVGIGYEDYLVTQKNSGADDTEINFKIIDIFLNLPLPIVNIALGYGAGSASINDVTGTNTTDGDFEFTFSDATITQYFISLGIPFGLLFDIHVGYHVLDGESDVKLVTDNSGTSKDKVDLSATMTSLGIKFGF